ncbi:MAG: alpha/beta hydrolase [Candidatus Hermodarchaeota archaeon]
MDEIKQNKRYIIDNFRAKNLEDNPLNSPVDRDLRIYLPPDYYDSDDTKYPVLYFLHGYGGNNHNWTITSSLEKDKVLPLDRVPKSILEKIDLDKIITYEKIDELILNEDLKPFILVQPDASLHLPNINNTKNLNGKIATKGSYYVNSPFSGNYRDYIARDVIEYIDSSYRTIPDNQHRALIGGSMGGAGTLRICINYPEKFIAAAALSPGNLVRELIDWQLIVPLNKELFGEKISKMMGAKTWADILDTCDLIFSKNNPLLPSIKRDESGKVISLNQVSLNNWMRYNITNLIREFPNSLKNVNLLVNCAVNDEMGSAIATKEIHETLNQYGVAHHYELYDDPKAFLSPHILGIAYHILPSIQFCLQFIN